MLLGFVRPLSGCVKSKVAVPVLDALFVEIEACGGDRAVEENNRVIG